MLVTNPGDPGAQKRIVSRNPEAAKAMQSNPDPLQGEDDWDAKVQRLRRVRTSPKGGIRLSIGWGTFSPRGTCWLGNGEPQEETLPGERLALIGDDF